jgi:hypothetical protein
MGLSFKIAAGSGQRTHSQVRVPRDSWPHFTVSDSRLSPTWRARSPFYIPQEQGGPVTPPGTGFPYRRLLRLAGLRWRYSSPPPHGLGKHFSEATNKYPTIMKFFKAVFSIQSVQSLYCITRTRAESTVTPQTIWPTAKSLTKRNGPKAPSAIYGPLGPILYPIDKANIIADCLETQFRAHDLCDCGHRRHVEAQD